MGRSVSAGSINIWKRKMTFKQYYVCEFDVVLKQTVKSTLEKKLFREMGMCRAG